MLARLTHKQGPICQPLTVTLQNPEQGPICQPLTVTVIEARRARHGVSQRQLCAAAGCNRDTWFDAIAGRVTPRQSTLRRVAAALDALIARAVPRRPPAAIAGLVNAVEALLLQELAPNGVRNAALLMRVNPRLGGKPNAALLPSRVHAMALYLVSVELQIANVEIARALNSSRENVRKLRPIIEDLRDDAEVEALFARVTAKLMGEAA